MSRKFTIRRDIVADHLNVDRRRQAEIQNLADDVRRLVKENEIRKALRQLAAQGADIIKGRSADDPRSSETKMSPSAGPIVAETLKARLTPL